MVGTAARPGTHPSVAGPGAPRRRRRGPSAVLVAVVVLLLAVTVPAVAGALGSGAAPLRELRILVPNTPGGGYDVTARSTARVLADTGITGQVEVFNLPGAGGVAGLATRWETTGC